MKPATGSLDGMQGDDAGRLSFQKNKAQGTKKTKETLFVKLTAPACVSDFLHQIVEWKSKNKIKRCRLEIVSGLSRAG
jgi:hypothetical protein